MKPQVPWKRNAGIRVCAQCRGEGLGYVALCSNERCDSLRVQVVDGAGTALPSSTFAVESALVHDALAPDVPMLWIVTMPLVASPVVVRVFDGDVGLLQKTISPLQFKAASRILSVRKPQMAAALRGYERRFGAGRARASIDEVWPTESSQVVWRIRTSFPVSDLSAGKRPEPTLRVFDAFAHEVDAQVVVMEDQIAPDERDAMRLVRLVTFSCRMPQEVASFFVVARVGEAEAFDGMNAPRAAGMLAHIRSLTTDEENNGRYARWFEDHRTTRAELDLQRVQCAQAFGEGRRAFGLVLSATGGAESLKASLESLVRQTYDRWEALVVADAATYDEACAVVGGLGDDRVHARRTDGGSWANTVGEGLRESHGDFVGCLRCGDTLEPDALWRFAAWCEDHAGAAGLYCDEDHADGSAFHTPMFKTFPNYGRLYGSNYVGSMLMIDRHVLADIELPDQNVAGAEDYDLVLKVFECGREIVHVPRVLYHRHGGDKPADWAAGQRALQAHLQRRGIAASVVAGPLEGTYAVRFEVPDPAPLVSIVIPTRDQAPLLRACVESIVAKTTYPNYEVVLVENNSAEPQTFALYEDLCARDRRVRVVTWTPDEPGTFNYSAIVNNGVGQSAGELVVLLNNDTEVIEPCWLEEMVGCLMRPEVGVVGAKLLFGDGLIQHTGMAANPEGNFCHVCQNLTREAPGPQGRAILSSDWSMVTGACQMVRRSLFDQLGGYDEQLAVGFNDGDFCLRAREAGYSVTLAVRALLHHREFSTRGRERTDARLRKRFLAERARMMQKHADFFATGDPAINANLNPFGSYFEL